MFDFAWGECGQIALPLQWPLLPISVPAINNSAPFLFNTNHVWWLLLLASAATSAASTTIVISGALDCVLHHGGHYSLRCLPCSVNVFSSTSQPTQYVCVMYATTPCSLIGAYPMLTLDVRHEDGRLVLTMVGAIVAMRTWWADDGEPTQRLFLKCIVNMRELCDVGCTQR